MKNAFSSLGKPTLITIIWFIGFLVANICGVFVPLAMKIPVKSAQGILLATGSMAILMVGFSLLLNRWYAKAKIYSKLTGIFKSYLTDIFYIIYLTSIMMIIFEHKAHNLGLSFLTAFAVAASEELIIRGIILGKVLEIWKGTHKIWAAIIISSIFFAIIHLINALHQPLSATIIQVAYTFFMGMILAIVYLKTGTLLSAILFHGLIDTYGFIQTNSFNVVNSQGNWTTVGICAVMSLFFIISILRKGQMDRIKTNFKI